MTKLKLLALSVIGLLIINLSIIAFLFLRKPPHSQGDSRPFKRIEPKNRVIEILHFDNEQVVQYEELIVQHRKSMKKLNDLIREAKSNLYETLNEDSAESKDSLINELSALQRKIESVHYNHFIEIRKLCKPDQLPYFHNLTGDLSDFFNPEKPMHALPKE
jgi:periplasmic protein CpxP/Spy